MSPPHHLQKAQPEGSTTHTNPSVMSDTSPAMPGALPPSPLREQATLPKPKSKSIPVSPARQPHNTLMAASSPSRLRSSSPRLQSPASTEIFERSVQEPIPIATLHHELTPAHIPNHVLTEDHIPAALEASAEAITSSNLNADEVEIVTATSHQPAGASLASSSTADVSSINAHLPPSLLHQASDGSEHASLNATSSSSGFLPPASHLEEENASSYGALDPNDVHRLSFISFADVVQSEHAHPTAASDLVGSRDSLHISSQPATSPRSPSSTYSSGGVITPPLTLGHSNQIESALSRHADQSPARSIPVGSPGASSAHGELTIETMRQAVRKTASGDLSGVRSTNLSPVASTVASEDLFARQGRSRTNT